MNEWLPPPEIRAKLSLAVCGYCLDVSMTIPRWQWRFHKEKGIRFWVITLGIFEIVVVDQAWNTLNT